MGMTPLEYARITFAQYVLKCEGYENKRARDNEGLRLIAWHVYLSIPKKEGFMDAGLYEFWPLRNDPTKEQILAAEKRAEKNKVKELEKEGMAMLARFEKIGIIQNGRVVSEVPLKEV